ncbi:MFS transporter [Nocardia nova]|uniref:MFS transporter n=1 Tax=Nocardia nova TaxID=37330 RepID=UPI0011DD92A4|nr:MFS transporter [Nocardia nova]
MSSTGSVDFEDAAAVARRSGPTIPRAFGFVVAVVSLMLIFATAGAPAALYLTYESAYGVSQAVIALAFGAYICSAAVTLVVFGRISDYCGRRRVAVATLGIALASCVVLAAAPGMGGVLLGRALQGVAAGLGMSAVSAYVADLGGAGADTRRAQVATSIGPTAGVALGAAGAGLLVSVVPRPEVTIFAGLAVAQALCAVVLVACPETRDRRPGALRSLRPAVGIPAGRGWVFAAICLATVSCWAMGGFYQAMGPVVLADVFTGAPRAAGGLSVAALIGVTPLGTVIAARLRRRSAIRAGLGCYAAGVVLVLVAVVTRDVALFFAASMVAGIGFGMSFSSALGTVLVLSAPGELAGALSAFYLISYLGAAVPAVVSGAVARTVGVYGVTLGYGALVVAAAGAAGLLVARRID